VLQSCGAAVTVHKHNITVSNQASLKAFVFDATDCPDLFPPLVALAAYCDGISIIKGTARLVAKESNRAESLTDVFTKMGIDVSVNDNEMYVVGGKVKAASVDAHDDHRIVMACAVAGLRSKGNIIIAGAGAVEKSYPAFFDHIRMLGAAVSLE
jgi:3-phosphoshikimate 1-carboxyvinyltransferase